MNITEGNTKYENVQVRNVSSASIDIKEELEGELGFKMEKTDEPQVLIYHTHASESYLPYDTGYFYESFFPRDTDTSNNVCAVGEEIADHAAAALVPVVAPGQRAVGGGGVVGDQPAAHVRDPAQHHWHTSISACPG